MDLLPKEFNYEQAKASVQWFINTFSGAIIGYAVGKGWVDADMATALINSPTLIAALASGLMLGWSMVQRLKKNRVADVAQMTEVKAVVLEPVAVVKAPALAIKTPDNVVTAGTEAAAELARK